jgi:membrane associated rhomboid family serine protease
MRDEVQMSFGLPKLTPVVKGLLVVLGVSFVCLALESRFLRGGVDVRSLLALDSFYVLQGQRLWTLLTYALVHDLESPWHILFNCIVLYFFGPALEERWGSARFALFSLAAVLVGGLFVVASGLLHLGSGAAVGASAICAGGVVAWCLMYPEKEVYIYFFQVKGKHMLWMSVGLEVLNALTNSGISAAGHFGGMTVGAVAGALSAGPIRRWWLERKLKSLTAQKASLGGSGKRAAASGLRVISGGRDDPKSKRYLN